MANSFILPGRVHLTTAEAERKLAAFLSKANQAQVNLSFNSRGFTQPLGRITGSVDEFRKSLEASNARVIAFSASAGVLYGITRGFKEMVDATIKVEKSLIDINVILNTSTKNLESFGSSLFDIAKKTGQSFFVVSEAAVEFARQGLSIEETLTRTKDALILVRLSGMDTKTAVSSLTAAMNSFSEASLTSTEIINKLANVDASFAVSSRDLAEAISRVGSSAESVNVSFDELLATVTSVQQTTARGGSIIGNSLKTIFGRVQREDVVEQLKGLGVEVRDLEGNVRPTMVVLKELAKIYESLTPSVKSQTTELVGGVYQMNILKALLKDLGREYSFYDKSLNVASKSTNQATKRNEELNKTIHTTLNESIQVLTELGLKVGKLTLEPAIKSVLEGINSLSKENKMIGGIGAFLGFDEKSSQEFGGKIAKGILQSLGNFISGPGLLLIGAVIAKLTFNFASFLGKSTKDMFGLNNAAHEQATIQKAIQDILSKHTDLVGQITAKERSRFSVEREILAVLEKEIFLREKIKNLSIAIAPGMKADGVIGIVDRVTGQTSLSSAKLPKGKNSGHIPNLKSTREAQEYVGAIQAGYKPGSIKQMNIPGEGMVTYNTAEKVKRFQFFNQPAIMPPLGSEAGKKYKKAFEDKHGFNPYKNRGFVPNLVGKDSNTNVKKFHDFDETLATYDKGTNPKDLFFAHSVLKSLPTPLAKDLKGQLVSVLTARGNTSRENIAKKLNSWGINVDKILTAANFFNDLKISADGSGKIIRNPSREGRIKGYRNLNSAEKKALLLDKMQRKLGGKFHLIDDSKSNVDAANSTRNPNISAEIYSFLGQVAGRGSNFYSSGFIPNFSSAPNPDSINKALLTEKAMGGDPVLDYHDRIGYYVRDKKTQQKFSDVL